VLHILLRLAQEIQRNHLALVVLDLAVATNRLHSDTNVHQLAVDAPVVALGLVADLHRHQVRLARPELAKDDHARA
jgi:hypothetical protein